MEVYDKISEKYDYIYAVSYTHLDVYKRQGKRYRLHGNNRTAGKAHRKAWNDNQTADDSCKRFGRKLGVMKNVGIIKRLPAGIYGNGYRRSLDAVSYTHL